MLTTQACSQVAIGEFNLGLNPPVFPRMINGHSVVVIMNISVFVDAALAKLHRAAVKAKISTEATS